VEQINVININETRAIPESDGYSLIYPRFLPYISQEVKAKDRKSFTGT